METIELKNKIESLLFISHKPITVSEVAKIMGIEKKEVEDVINILAQEYQEKNSGIQIIHADGKFQMASSSGSSEIVSKFLKSEITGELTRPSLETLTIIAYRGPISKTELELLRGVNCSLILRNLLMRGLIEGHDDKLAGVTKYTITLDFLKHLGMSQISELPDYDRLNKNNNLDKLLNGLGEENKEIKEELEIKD
ncbi:MAG: SMC-Scp complex subunit ScpB [Patescibacteria group bacterium]|jgi:segregation and condensation protein B